MMMVPRSFVQVPLPQRQRQDFTEKDSPESNYKSSSDPVKIPSRNSRRNLALAQRPAPTVLQNPKPASIQSTQIIPTRRESVQQILSSTTIPIRRKPRPRPAQRIPDGDYVTDFSKLLRADVQSAGDGPVASSWTNPQFEGLFGNIDGFIDGEMIVGSEGVDASVLSARSISSESMPSLVSPDDFSSSDLPSFSPATIRSPSEHRLRQMASSEDCSSQHPLLAMDEDDQYSNPETPELVISPPSTKPRRRDLSQQKHHSSFKSSLTASLKALKSAALTVSTIATTPPLLQPDEFLGASIFDFKPELTDDRRPPPSQEPPSAAMRRYLNPRSSIPADSPAQLHFWLDEKPSPSSHSEGKPKLKIKKKYQAQIANSSKIRGFRSRTSQLPPVVQLATCIPSAVRTAYASSPPTWLEPDGTPSNKHRAAQTLVEDASDQIASEGQSRPREPRENRDFLRIYVCELNMRKCGKFADDAVGHAKLWLPPVVEDKEKRKLGEEDEKNRRAARWTSWTSDDL